MKSTDYTSNDDEEYYPFVIGRGKSFKIIDPKVYKQLRKNNLAQTKHIRIAECAKKTPRVSNKTTTGQRPTVKTSLLEKHDEYCELSPLASGPAPYIPPRRPKKLPDKPDMREVRVKKLPTTRQPVANTNTNTNTRTNINSRTRVQNEYYDPKAWMVQLNSTKIDSSVSTELCKDKVDLKKHFKTEDECDEYSRVCGRDAEEVVDYLTCMCCAKGLFYHCTKDSEDEGRIADDPCSCSGPLKSCLPRWGCLAVLSIFLPCLFCYLPISGCRKASSCISCKKKKKKTQKKTPKSQEKTILTS